MSRALPPYPAGPDMNRVALGVLLFGALAGCSKEKAGKPTGTSAAAPSASLVPAPPLPAPVASGLPSPQVVSAEVNPNKEPVYSGPVGTVRGKVIATGDHAPEQTQVLAKIPPTCPVGREMYGKLFREGPGRTLADVLVAVTGYQGYVPELAPAQRVEAKDCSFGTRTLALTFGQRIDVVSKDQQSYIPELIGEHGQPQLVATPGNATAATLFPTHIGHFGLIDDLKLFMTADVLVVKFATHAVTGLDGTFEIKGVPVGPVKVNALLPVTGGGAERSVTVEAGKASELVLEVPFDAKDFAQKVEASLPAPSGSAAPARPPTAPSAKPHTAKPRP
jgi:hypothetical protein